LCARRLLTRRLLSCVLFLSGFCCFAQTVSPVIVEYKGKAEGKIALTNDTLAPMAVVLEPRSFSVTADGNGVYRSLDPEIHVELSSMSFRIDPGQTYYVFYKAKADKLPAWFTVYSTFSAVKHTSGLDVRILLPHTVYIYAKKPQSKQDLVDVKQAVYLNNTGKVVCDFANDTSDLERVEEMRITSQSKSVTSAGFPLLPGSRRHIEVDWKETEPPRQVVLQMDRSTLKLPLRIGE
jgi:hypothetical protein